MFVALVDGFENAGEVDVGQICWCASTEMNMARATGPGIHQAGGPANVLDTSRIYGFGRMTVNGSTHLLYEFVDTDGVVHDTWRIVKTGAA